MKTYYFLRWVKQSYAEELEECVVFEVPPDYGEGYLTAVMCLALKAGRYTTLQSVVHTYMGKEYEWTRKYWRPKVMVEL